MEAWSDSLGESLPLSGPQFPKCKIRGWIVGPEGLLALTFPLVAKCKPIPAFLQSPSESGIFTSPMGLFPSG